MCGRQTENVGKCVAGISTDAWFKTGTKTIMQFPAIHTMGGSVIFAALLINLTHKPVEVMSSAEWGKHGEWRKSGQNNTDDGKERTEIVEVYLGVVRRQTEN